MNERADRLAAGLAAQGVGRGDAVGLYLHNSPAYLEGFIAACKLGAVPYNVNYRYRAEELRYLFANADSAAVIHGAEFAPIMREVRGEVPTLKVTVAVEDGSGEDISGSVPYADLMAHDPAGPWERSQEDYLLCYTGGTTGMPKGVMWPHRAFLFACAGGAGYFNPHGPIVQPQDIESRARDGYPLKMFPLAPLMHMAAMWSVWSAILNGVTIIFDEGRVFDPERIFDTAEREGANLIQFVGDAMATPLRDALRAHPGRCGTCPPWSTSGPAGRYSPSISRTISRLWSPAPRLPTGWALRKPGCRVWPKSRMTAWMRSAANAQQQVVVDGQRLAKVGEVGLIARTGNTPIGYYGDPVKTAETFVTIEGTLWAVSGDAGRLDADGMITMFGRGSTCINTGGEKVFPEEVEEVLRTHPAVFDAVVAGQPGRALGERVIGVVSRRADVAEPGARRDQGLPRRAAGLLQGAGEGAGLGGRGQALARRQAGLPLGQGVSAKNAA